MITISKNHDTSNTRDYTIRSDETGRECKVVLTSPDAVMPNMWLLCTPRYNGLKSRMKYHRYPNKHEALSAGIEYCEPEPEQEPRWTVARVGTNNMPVILIDPRSYSKFTGYDTFGYMQACSHAQELRQANPTEVYIITETLQPPSQRG